MQRLRRPWLAAIALITVSACQEPPGAPSSASAAPDTQAATRAQTWSICQDPNRGLAAANACSALIASGQETKQTLVYIHYNRGLALSRRGRIQAAIDDFDAALTQDPFFALALYQRGLAYQSLGLQVRGDQDLQRARQLNPRLP